jgi:hypothetical protein
MLESKPKDLKFLKIKLKSPPKELPHNFYNVETRTGGFFLKKRKKFTTLKIAPFTERKRNGGKGRWEMFQQMESHLEQRICFCHMSQQMESHLEKRIAIVE